MTGDDLLAAVWERPDDDAPRLVYADWLQEQGDPRGEFIALQISGRDPAREAELLAQHSLDWLGDLRPAVAPDRPIVYARGFPHELTVNVVAPEVVARLATHPAWRTIHTATLAGTTGQSITDWTVLDAMCSLRVLRGGQLSLLSKGIPLPVEHLDLYVEPETTVRALRRCPRFPRLHTLEMWTVEPHARAADAVFIFARERALRDVRLHVATAHVEVWLPEIVSRRATMSLRVRGPSLGWNVDARDGAIAIWFGTSAPWTLSPFHNGRNPVSKLIAYLRAVDASRIARLEISSTLPAARGPDFAHLDAALRELGLTDRTTYDRLQVADGFN